MPIRLAKILQFTWESPHVRNGKRIISCNRMAGKPHATLCTNATASTAKYLNGLLKGYRFYPNKKLYKFTLIYCLVYAYDHFFCFT